MDEPKKLTEVRLLLEAQVRPIIASHLSGHKDSDPEQALEILDGLESLRQALELAIEKKNTLGAGFTEEGNAKDSSEAARNLGRNRESQYRQYIILSYLNNTNDSYSALEFQEQIRRFNLDVKVDTLRTQLSRMCDMALIERQGVDLYSITSAGQRQLEKLSASYGRKVEELRTSK